MGLDMYFSSNKSFYKHDEKEDKQRKKILKIFPDFPICDNLGYVKVETADKIYCDKCNETADKIYCDKCNKWLGYVKEPWSAEAGNKYFCSKKCYDTKIKSC